MSTGYLALCELLGQSKVSLAGLYDTDAELRSVADVVHPGSDRVHLGAAGDVLGMDVDQFPDSEVVIAGPPCPPWASLGKRKSRRSQGSGVLEDCRRGHRKRPAASDDRVCH